MDQSYLSGPLQFINLHPVPIYGNGGNPGSRSAEHGPHRLHLRIFDGYAVAGFNQNTSCDIEALLNSGDN